MSSIQPSRPWPVRILTPLVRRIRLAHVLFVTCLLLLPALTNTFYGDDFHHYAQLNGKAESLAVDDLSLFGLFSFVGKDPDRRAELKNLSIIPWWAGETFTWKFWRPVTELTLYIDYVVLKYPPLMHLHSILWYLVVIVLLYQLLRRLFSRQSTALLATALFALNGAHGLLVGWLCSRSPLVACFFSLLTLLIHHRSVTRNSYPLMSLALVTFTLSLLSAEIGLSTSAWLFAYAMFIDKRALPTRFLSLVPFAIIVIIWWGIYQWAGFGVSASNDFYIEPAAQPAAFLKQLLGHIPVLTFSQLSAIPSDLLAKGIPGLIATIGGLAGFAIIGLLYKHTEQRKLLLFLLTGSILSMFPLASAPLQDRNVIFVSIGFAGILALGINTLWQRIQQYSSAAINTALCTLLLLHFCVSPVVLYFSGRSPTFLAEPSLRRAATLQYQPGDRIIIFGAPAMEAAYLAPGLLHFNDAMPASIWNLVGRQRNFKVDLVDLHTLHLTSSKGLINHSEQFVRNLATEPFAAGDEIKLNGLRIEIKQTNDYGQPTEVIYHTASPLTDYVMVRWFWKEYKPVNPDDFPLTKKGSLN